MRRFLILAALLVAATTAHAATNYFEGRTESADGVEIAYVTQGAGQQTLVFVHGWSCDRTYWRDQVRHFSDSYKMITVDLAGHGNSGTGRTEYTMEAFGADVAAVLEAQNIYDAVLVGHSMGGPVVVEAALQAADRVRGVIGVDNFQSMTVEFPPEQLAAWIGALEGDFAGTVDPWVRSMFPADADPELRDAVAADMAAGDPAVGVDAMKHTLPWMVGGGVPQLQRLGVNLVCVNSDLNPTDETGNQEIVPGFRAWILPGTGHFLMREQPEAFNALLDEALATFGYGPPRAPGGLNVE